MNFFILCKWKINLFLISLIIKSRSQIFLMRHSLYLPFRGPLPKVSFCSYWSHHYCFECFWQSLLTKLGIILAKSLQLCQTLCDPMDCSPPGSSVRGILCAKILKWVALSYSGDLPNPRIEPSCPMSPALAGRFFTAGIGNLIITRPEGLKLGLHKVKEWTFIWYGISLLMWLLGLHIVDSWSLKGRLRRLEAGVMR